MQTQRKAKLHHKMAFFFGLMKAFLLLLLLGQMQTASAEVSCGAAVYGETRVCIGVYSFKREIGYITTIDAWTETRYLNRFSNSNEGHQIDLYFRGGKLPTTVSNSGPRMGIASFTYVAGAGDNGLIKGLGTETFTAINRVRNANVEVQVQNVPNDASLTMSLDKPSIKMGENFNLKYHVSAFRPKGILEIKLIESPDGPSDFLREEWIEPKIYAHDVIPLKPLKAGKYTFQATFVSTSPENVFQKGRDTVTQSIFVQHAALQNYLSFSTTSTDGIRPGSPVTLTATLVGNIGPVTGFVSFYEVWSREKTFEIARVPIIDNKAVVVTTALKSLGNIPVQAFFHGSSLYESTHSPITNIEVTQGKSTTTLSSSQSQSALGKPVTFSAQVGGTNPTGSVSFFDGGNLIGTATVVGGVANLEIATIQTLGDHVITATYGGDESNAASTSLPITQTILQGVTVNKLSAITQTPAASGSLVILTADLTGDGIGRTGSIEFFEGEALLGSSTVSNNRAEISTNSLKTLGAHTLRAKYSGDANFAASTSDDLTVTIELAKSETVLTSAASPVMAGKPVSLTAQVTGLNPTGSVSFYDKTTLLGKANLQNGVASLTTSAIRSVGVREITAVYSGDELNRSSTSANLQQTMLFNPAYLMPVLQLLLN